MISLLHVNIFYENSCIVQTKEIQWKRCHCFTFLQVSLVPGLMEDTWILILASAFNLLCHIFFFFWLKYMKKILSHTDM